MAPTFDDYEMTRDQLARTLTEAHVFLLKADDAIQRGHEACAALRRVLEASEAALRSDLIHFGEPARLEDSNPNKTFVRSLPDEAASARPGWDALVAARCDCHDEGFAGLPERLQGFAGLPERLQATSGEEAP